MRMNNFNFFRMFGRRNISIYVVIIGSYISGIICPPPKGGLVITNNIVRGIPSAWFEKEIEKSVDDHLFDAAKTRTNNVFLINSKTGEQLLMNDFFRKSTALAAALRDLGCGRGTYVGIMTPNRLETPITMMATLLNGSTFTGYIPNYSFEELELVYGLIKPEIMLCALQYCEKIKKVATETKHFIVIDTDDVVPDDAPYLRYSKLIESGSKKEFQRVQNRSDDVATIVYSSGTTGLPKAVMLTHKNVMFGILYLNENIEKTGSPTIVPGLLSHVTGSTSVLAAVARNETVVFIPEVDYVSSVWPAIEKYKISHMFLLPKFMARFLKDSALEKYNLSSLKFFFCGGAPISSDTEKALKEKFHLDYVQQVFGMTETSWTTVNRHPNEKGGTCGSPSGGTEMKIIRPETGETLGVEESGELCIRGPNVMKGYYQNEKATKETIDEEGWVHSGDIGHFDKDGDFFIVDRAKELFTMGGHQTSPAELETILLRHPLIADAAVIGIPHDEEGSEIARAYIIKEKDAHLTEDQVIQYMAEKVISYKQLHGGVEFVNSIPRNASGKILHKVLRKQWEQSLFKGAFGSDSKKSQESQSS